MIALLQKICLTAGKEEKAGLQDIRIARRFAGMLIEHLSAEEIQ